MVEEQKEPMFRASWAEKLAEKEAAIREIAVEKPVIPEIELPFIPPVVDMEDAGQQQHVAVVVAQTTEELIKEPTMEATKEVPSVVSPTPLVVAAEEMNLEDWLQLPTTTTADGEGALGNIQDIMAQLLRERLELEAGLSQQNALVDTLIKGRATALQEVRALYPGLLAASQVRYLAVNRFRDGEKAKAPKVVLDTLRDHVTKGEKMCTLAGGEIARREQQYPGIFKEVEAEMVIVGKALPLMEMFRTMTDGGTGTVCYVDTKTPAPSHTRAGGFLAEAVERAAKLGLLLQPSEGTAPVFSYRGRSWMAATEIPQLVELCQSLAGYASAILEAAHVEHERFVGWLTERAYLMSSDEMELQQKATTGEGESARRLCHRTFLDMVEKGQVGDYCFIELVPEKTSGRYEYGTGPYVKLMNIHSQEGKAKYGVEVASATTVEAAEQVFHATGKEWLRPRIYFSDAPKVPFLKSVSGNKVLGPAFSSAVRYAENKRKNDAARDRILAPTNTWITIHDMADGQVGTCPLNYKVERGWVVGLLISDGTTVTAGEFTPQSSRCQIAQEIGKGMAVGELFAKNGSGESVIGSVAEAVTKNEQYTIRWRLDVLAANHGAVRVNRDNVNGLALIGEEVHDGVYVSTLHIGQQDRRPEQDYGYVIMRDGEKIAFVAAATPVSARKLNVKFGELRTFAELPDFELFYLRRVYMNVTKTPQDKVPEHLRARNQQGSRGNRSESSNAHDQPTALA